MLYYHCVKIVFILILGAFCAGNARPQVQNELIPSFLKSENLQSDQKFISLVPKVEKEDLANASVTLYHSNHWKVMRQHPSGYLDVYCHEQNSKSWRRLKLAHAWRRSLYPMAILEEKQNLWIVAYDVSANLPSGRCPDKAAEQFDVYRIHPETEGGPEHLAGLPNLGGIDTLIYMGSSDGKIHVCGSNHCHTIEQTGKKTTWALDALQDYEFIEVVFEKDTAAAILRKKHDDRSQGAITAEFSEYSFALLKPRGVQLGTLPIGIPWDIRLANGKIGIHMANTFSEYASVFLYDLRRMRLAGLMDFGETNLEGRIAWSQVYYLNGLLSVLTTSQLKLENTVLNDLKQRFIQELDFISRIGATKYPYYFSKRYSIEREPLLFALHLGRIAHLFSRARVLGFTSELHEKTRLDILEKLKKISDTVEQLKTSTIQNQPISYLYYKKGSPFWADGIPVPYNYASGFSSGILGLDNNAAVELAAQLMQPLLLQELNQTLPKVWRYWWGSGDTGWHEDEHLSLNTPEWVGNKASLAHITYRSMDALALIQLYQKKPAYFPEDRIDHIRNLVEQGWLLPYLNEELVRVNKQAKLSILVAKRFARAASTYEIQSQIWALNALGELKAND